MNGWLWNAWFSMTQCLATSCSYLSNVQNHAWTRSHHDLHVPMPIQFFNLACTPIGLSKTDYNQVHDATHTASVVANFHNGCNPRVRLRGTYDHYRGGRTLRWGGTTVVVMPLQSFSASCSGIFSLGGFNNEALQQTNHNTQAWRRRKTGSQLLSDSSCNIDPQYSCLMARLYVTGAYWTLYHLSVCY